MLWRPVGLEETPSLLCLALLLLSGSPVWSQRLATSGGSGSGRVGSRFPEDLFSQPAVRLDWKAEPLRNSTALDIIAKDEIAWKRYQERRRRVSRAEDGSGNQADNEVGAREADGTLEKDARPPYLNYLIRTAPALIYLCRLPSNFSPAPDTERAKTTDEQRLSALKHGLTLLDPLKETCLFHTREWFTYSFCHGAEVRQFRALPGTSAPGRTPAVDPNYDSFVLGRWAPRAERIWVRKEDGSMTTTRHRLDPEPTPDKLHPQAHHLPTGVEEHEAGVELVELVRFSGMEDQRYLSQTWGGGTPCDKTNEPRTIEIQFHCAPKRLGDRISMIKETVTCNYIMIIETSRLCIEPTFTIGQEEPVHNVACHPIVADSWQQGQAIPGHSEASREALDEEAQQLALEIAPSTTVISARGPAVTTAASSHVDATARTSADSAAPPPDAASIGRSEAGDKPSLEQSSGLPEPEKSASSTGDSPSQAESDFHSYGTEGGRSIFDDNASLSEGKVAVVFVDEKGDYFVELMTPEEARLMEGGHVLPPDTEIREVIDERGEPAYDVMIDPVQLDAILAQPQGWLSDVVKEALPETTKEGNAKAQKVQGSNGQSAPPHSSEPKSQSQEGQGAPGEARKKFQDFVDLMLEHSPDEAAREKAGGNPENPEAGEKDASQHPERSTSGTAAQKNAPKGGAVADAKAKLLQDWNQQLREALLSALDEAKTEVVLEPKKVQGASGSDGKKVESLADRAARWYALKEKDGVKEKVDKGNEKGRDEL